MRQRRGVRARHRRRRVWSAPTETREVRRPGVGMDNAVGNGVCGDDAVLQDEVNESRELVMSQQGCGRAGKLKSGKSDSSFCLGELLITETIG